MSVSATVWAWEVQGISGTQKLVLLSLADRAGENHGCWPSISRVVTNTGLTKNTVRKAISDMCLLGLIKKEERHKNGRQTSNNYTLQVRGCEIIPPEGCEIGRGEGCEIGIQNLPEEPIKGTKPIVESPIQRFDDFWDSFADKRGKDGAEKVWKRRKLDNIATAVIQGAARYAAARPKDRSKCKMAQGWLTDGRWQDDITEQTQSKFDNIDYGEAGNL